MGGTKRSAAPVYAALRMDDRAIRQLANPDGQLVFAQALDCIPPFGMRGSALGVAPIVAAEFSGFQLTHDRDDGYWIDEIYATSGGAIFVMVPSVDMPAFNQGAFALDLPLTYGPDGNVSNAILDGISFLPGSYPATLSGNPGVIAQIATNTALLSRVRFPIWVPPGVEFGWAHDTVATAQTSILSIRYASTREQS